jgi:Immunity protein 22
MARYSIYDFEQKGMVSIWVSIVPWSQMPQDYFKENYGGGDDESFTQFSEDFGIGFYDHDFVDTNGNEDQSKALAELLAACSFSSSYIKEAVVEASRRSLDRPCYIFLLYDIAYDAKQTGVVKSASMEFLGAFRFDSKAPAAISENPT